MWFIIIHLFYEGVGPSLLHPRLAHISRRFAKLIFKFQGHVHTSKLSWDRLSSFLRLNFSFKLFPLCEFALRTLVTAVEIRMVVLAQSSWPLNTLNQAVASQWPMSEGTVIMDCCQSSYVCFASFARVAMATIK